MGKRALSRRPSALPSEADSDTVAIYGAGPNAVSLEQSIRAGGRREAVLADGFVSAHTHVLMQDDDAATLRLFSEYQDRFQKGDRVYLRLEDFDLNALDCGGVELHPFSLSELTARCFWQERAPWMCERCAGGGKVRVCLVGAGIFGEKLLTLGLLQNLYSLDQQVEYHLFGDWEEFRALHFDWAAIASPGDAVIFHGEPWYEARELLREADMLVLCDGDPRKNLHAAQRICSLLPRRELYLRWESARSPVTSADVRIFGGCEVLCTEENILWEKLAAAARHQHEAYREAHPESGIAPWAELDAFTRQSNLSSSVFQAVNLPLLQSRLAGLDKAERDELLAQLEHIRWSRYHYLHNWTWGPGKKDRTRRTHPDLTPYAQLSRADQLKDLEALKN